MTAGRLAIALSGAAAAIVVAAFATGALTPPAPGEPRLPPVAAEELIASILRATPVALAGTARLESQLGSDGLSPTDQARSVRVWADASGRSRISLPRPDGERTIVDDGATIWWWNSATRLVTQTPVRPASPVLPNLIGLPAAPGQADRHDQLRCGELVSNPVALASAVVGLVKPDSTARLDPAARVADRAVYELVLDPLPTARTLLREIRIAVDGQTRLPLEVSVSANGSAQPALRVGFTQIRFGPQQPSLFAFSPVHGVAVRRALPGGQPTTALRGPQNGPGPRGSRRTPDTTSGEPADRVSGPRVIGQGWDTVVVRRLPAGPPRANPSLAPLNPPIRLAWPSSLVGGRPATDDADTSADETETLALARISRPISGPWGHGRLVSTPIGNAVVTSDGRMASGAVPAQVLSEALGQ